MPRRVPITNVPVAAQRRRILCAGHNKKTRRPTASHTTHRKREMHARTHQILKTEHNRSRAVPVGCSALSFPQAARTSLFSSKSPTVSAVVPFSALGANTTVSSTGSMLWWVDSASTLFVFANSGMQTKCEIPPNWFDMSVHRFSADCPFCAVTSLRMMSVFSAGLSESVVTSSNWSEVSSA